MVNSIGGRYGGVFSQHRRYLDGILRRQGHLIDFVGTRRKHDDGKGQPTNHEYDPDHEGHWGKGSAWLAKKSRRRWLKIPLLEKEDTSGALLNRKISRCAEAHSTSQSPIVVADLVAGFVASEDRAQGGVRLTPHGAQKRARIVAKSVDRILSGDAKP